jgi:hypothetical protein
MEARGLRDDKLNDDMLNDIDSNKEIGNYFTYLDSISKALSKRLDELENENKTLKNELLIQRHEADEKELIIKKLNELGLKFEELSEKYEKEQKRAKLLEVENARNMDEMKNLRKENKILLSKTSDRSKETLLEKFQRLIK